LQEDFISRKETLEQFGSCREGLEDPRRGNAALHDFHEPLKIALCCVLCGGQGALDMDVLAEAKKPCLRSFLTLANGLPGHERGGARETCGDRQADRAASGVLLGDNSRRDNEAFIISIAAEAASRGFAVVPPDREAAR
jgi:hypothetical protein